MSVRLGTRGTRKVNARFWRSVYVSLKPVFTRRNIEGLLASCQGKVAKATLTTPALRSAVETGLREPNCFRYMLLLCKLQINQVYKRTN